MTIIDTNIICRFLLRDDESFYRKAKDVLSQDEIYIDAVITAESIWVLTNHYHQPKESVVEKLLSLINQTNSLQPQKKLVTSALNTYITHSISFIDCWLLSLHQYTHHPLATFDKDLTKLSTQYD